MGSIQEIADQIGWPLAIGLVVIVIADRAGLLSIKIGGKEKSVDMHERLEQRLDGQEDDIHALGLKVARIDAILEDRKTRS